MTDADDGDLFRQSMLIRRLLLEVNVVLIDLNFLVAQIVDK